MDFASWAWTAERLTFRAVVHIVGAVCLGRHMRCSRHGGLLVRKDEALPSDFQADVNTKSLGGVNGWDDGQGVRCTRELFSQDLLRDKGNKPRQGFGLR